MKHVLELDPVWEQTLSQDQIAKYQAFLDRLPDTDGEFAAAPVLGKYKKNGGFVATVLLRNGLDSAIALNEIEVEVTDGQGSRLAFASFNPELRISPGASMPWSFVFAPEATILHEGGAPADWKIHLAVKDKEQDAKMERSE